MKTESTQSTPKRIGRTYKGCNWVNTETEEEKFGIQVKLNGFEVRWMHCCEGSKPLIFDTSGERDQKLKELRRDERQGNMRDTESLRDAIESLTPICRVCGEFTDRHKSECHPLTTPTQSDE